MVTQQPLTLSVQFTHPSVGLYVPATVETSTGRCFTKEPPQKGQELGIQRLYIVVLLEPVKGAKHVMELPLKNCLKYVQLRESIFSVYCLAA